VALAALLAALLAAAPAAAWDDHRALTRLALRDAAGLDAVVTAETLESYLAASGQAGGVPAFLAAQTLNPAVGFPWLAGETGPGSTLTVRTVLSAYADEPDWGMDQDLFTAYPRLWKDDYKYMGGRTGTQTRAVRHMYWALGFYKEPPPGGRLPVHDPSPLGEAPERCALFFDLSRQAFAAGHPYWGARFLSWSLHYYQDLTMPFHAAQLPATDFLRFKPDGSLDLELTTRLVIYTHLAVDAFPQRSAAGALGAAASAAVRGALGGRDAAAFSSAKALAQSAAVASARAARKAGLGALQFFPEPDAAALADPLAATQDAGYWSALSAQMAADPAGAEDYVRLAAETVAPLGPGTRALVYAAVPPLAAPLGLSRSVQRLGRLLGGPLPLLP
jgi:hypothetical protein